MQNKLSKVYWQTSNFLVWKIKAHRNSSFAYLFLSFLPAPLPTSDQLCSTIVFSKDHMLFLASSVCTHYFLHGVPYFPYLLEDS